jgi:hypothetical protein
MDILNHLFAQTGRLSRIDVVMIGRMAVGWSRGRFRYCDPNEMAPVANERFYGALAHYIIGVVLAVAYMLSWKILTNDPPSPAWALIYGIATTPASLFLVYPLMGLGACGRRAPDGSRNLYSSLANHLFFGMGMALVIALL